MSTEAIPEPTGINVPAETSLEAAAMRLMDGPEETQQPEPTEPVTAELDEVEEEGDEAPMSETSELEEEPTEEEEEGQEEVEQEGEEQEPTEYYAVKIDGEELEVTLDELQSGYQRQKDYTRKTQAVSAERKEYEAKQSEMTALHDNFMQEAGMANELLNRDLKAFEAVDWNSLKETDPVGYVQKQIELNDVKEQQQALRTQAQQAYEFNQKAEAEGRSHYLETQKKEALSYFPEWKDHEKAQVHVGKIFEYARNNGYSEDALTGIVNAKDFLMLDKARQFDELKATKKSIKKKVTPAIRKPLASKGKAPKGASSRKRTQESRDKLRETGSVKDAAALMYQLQTQKSIRK
jgi:hypothetical protein